MDSARVAKRVNQGKVTLVYRRGIDELPARKEEVHHAKAEGIEFNLLCNPLVLGDDQHRVVGIECIRMELGEPDDLAVASPSRKRQRVHSRLRRGHRRDRQLRRIRC